MTEVVTVSEAFATTDQMAQRTQGAITTTSHPFLASELEAATQAIRGVCGWHVAPQRKLVYTHIGTYLRGVFLPAMQITAITAATVDGVVIDITTIEFDPNTGWTNIVGRKARIEYTAGYIDMPPELVSLTLQIVGRSLGSTMGATREQTLVSNVNWATVAPGVSGGVVVMEHEREALAPFTLGPIP